MSTSQENNKDGPKKGLPAPAELAKSKETTAIKKASTAPPAPPTPPKGDKSSGGGDENRRPAAKGNPALVGAGLTLGILLLIGLIAFMAISAFKNMNKVPVASAQSAESAEIARLRAQLEQQEAAAPTTHPSVSNGVKTFDPTTKLDGRNLPNIPTVTRVQKIAAPAGDIYLLFGEDPLLKRERMITNGGNAQALPEPEWKVTRPPGDLVILKRPPPGLNLPPGRFAVAIVAGGKG